MKICCLQVAVHDIHSERMARAGLQSLGVASGMGRGGLDKVLRITPGKSSNPAMDFMAWRCEQDQ